MNIQNNENAHRFYQRLQKEVQEEDKLLAELRSQIIRFRIIRSNKYNDATGSINEWNGENLVIDPSDTAIKIEATIKAYTACLDREKHNTNCRRHHLESAEQEYNDAIQENMQLETNFNYLIANIHDMKKDRKNRYRKWKRSRKSIANKVNVLFNVYLSAKKFSGTVKCNHNKKTLKLKVGRR